MQLVIRRLSADGAVEDAFDGDELIIGRATDSTVSLPGLLVALRHARLTARSQYLLKLESLCPMGVELNGLSGVQSADVQAGDVIRIGGHQLRVTVAEGGGLALEIELADPSNALARTDARTSLADAGLRMRRPAMWLAWLTLFVGLLVPLASHFIQLPEPARAVVPTDRLWLTNGIANAHKHFGSDCGTCHETLFVRVRDRACLACHANIAHHSDEPAIQNVDGLSDRRCASCHREHQGPHGVVPAHPGICTDCHADPQRFAQFPDLQPVGDFADDHPEFRPTIALAKGEERVLTRVPLGQQLRDSSGMIFPHDVHLLTGGVRGPEGPEPLDCASCHVRKRGEASFQAVDFEPHCQRCHQLDIDIGGSLVRLPHGDNELARTALLTYAKAEREVVLEPEPVSTRRRPGDAAPRGGRVGPEELVNEAIENRVCAKCHEIAREPGQPVSTRPLMLRQSWLVHARFTHEAHSWQKCDDCHSEQSSAIAEDLSLPAIASCRDCHGGVNSADRLASTCVDCHKFHEASKLTMGALADELAGGAKQQ